MSTRADKFTQTGKKKDLFSDFLNNFESHPVNKSLVRITNEQSVKQSIRNLVLTSLGERLFQPTIGSNVLRTLFEPNDLITAENIVFHITNTIKYNEPRANIVRVEAIPNDMTDSVAVNIVFSLINNPIPITLNLILKRVR